MGRGMRLRGGRLWLACGSGGGHGWLTWGWDDRNFGRRGGLGGAAIALFALRRGVVPTLLAAAAAGIILTSIGLPLPH